ncbi:hypothetical protein EV175_000601 [Coemansia sp. RSA 1933]|nr:hypothetical protein EV175_000601 [Coemansia sp. RSA 1933]
MKGRSFELIDNSSGEQRKVLTGSYGNFLRRKAMIRSEHGLSSANRNGMFTNGWTFVFMSNQYKWTVPPFSKTWTLKDINDREVATFSRAMFKPRRIGKLEIHSQQSETLDPDFVALILLTCKFVHNTVKRNERRAASN